jgi:hypothetical protein
MKKVGIERKFDEIVDFVEVDEVLAAKGGAVRMTLVKGEQPVIRSRRSFWKDAFCGRDRGRALRR